MSIEQDLYRLEEGFWLSGKEHFLDHLDERCLLVFPQAGQMHGIHAREEVAATASMPNRWRDLRMLDRHCLCPTAELAILSYRAEVTRHDGEPYRALIGSTYVRRAAGWKLTAHQHSPV